MKQLGFWDHIDLGWDFGSIPHHYEGRICSKCGSTADDVASGAASFICAARIQPCCDKAGISKWDSNKNQWLCSTCSAVQSNDPNYIGSGLYGDIWKRKSDPLVHQVVHPPSPKKCDCRIELLMQAGCQCKGV